MIEQHEPDSETDQGIDEPVRAMRGVVFGLLFSAVFWLAVLQVVVWVLRWVEATGWRGE
jgi:hypothetical protein